MPSGRPAFSAALIAAVSLACACSTTAAAQVGAPPAEGSADRAPAGRDTRAMDMAAGRSSFEKACSECHELGFATQMRNSREGWTQIVDRMVSNGMDASAEQKKQIVDYLAEAYPPKP